jgi:hypothetical protein
MVSYFSNKITMYQGVTAHHRCPHGRLFINVQYLSSSKGKVFEPRRKKE